MSEASFSMRLGTDSMALNLERAGLIRRQPGVARSIELLVAPEKLPILN